MKAGTPNKAGGASPVKKVVKKVPAKAGASVAAKSAVGSAGPSPTPKKDGSSKPASSQAKPAGLKTQEPETVPASKAQVDPTPESASKNVADDKSAAIGFKKPSEPGKAGEKPKKTVIVKKKVVVAKKSSASAVSSASEPANTPNPVNIGEKPANLESEPTKQQEASSGSDLALENPSVKEVKSTSLASEKPQKVIKKVVGKGKGSSTEVRKDSKQDIEAAVERNSEVPVQQKIEAAVKMNNSDTSKSTIEGSLPSKKDHKEVEADEVEDCDTMDAATEELQPCGNHEFEEEPEYEEDIDEEQGAEIEEDYHTDMAQTRPVSERQKRKKLEVFVGGLDKDATEDDVRAAFKPVGDVMEVRLMMNPVTGKNKGYAFVRFATTEQAGRAATEFAATQIRGKECGVLPNQDNDTLFIGNISRDWKSSEVLQKLKEFGINGVEELTLIGDPQNEALNRGYAFLELATHYDAVNAFQRLQRPGVMFGYDRPAKVSWAQPLNEADASTMSQVKSVFVDGIPPNWTEDKVKQSFEKFGEIERIVLARNMPFAKRKDFAFVNFASRENALACVEAFRETELSDGDRKVKVRVSLTRPLQKGRGDKWSTPRHRGGYSGQGRGQAGRGEGWFATRFGSRGSGRGYGWSGGRGMVGRGGKRLYDEDEVRMMLKALREEEGWPSTARGRGGRYGRTSRGMARGGYTRNDESRHYDARRADSYRQQNEAAYTHDAYSRPASDLATSRGKAPRPGPTNEVAYAQDAYNRPASDLPTSRGKAPRPGPMRDDYEPQHLGPSSRSRVLQHPDRYPSPRHEGAHHHRYEQGPIYGRDEAAFVGDAQDYNELGVGMKRPVSTWDEDFSYYESSHRGHPRARVDYSDPGHFPENVAHYPSHARSPAGPATQTLGIRQARPAREGPITSFYDSGSGLGKAGVTSAYNDHSYNTMLPETSNYLSEAPERRDSSMYPSSLYGGHSGSAGYDLQAPGYY